MKEQLIKPTFIKNLLFIVLPVVIYLIPALVTISDYNVNWDEPVHFNRGQAYLRYYLTGEKTYKNLPLFKEFSYSLQQRDKQPKVSLPRYSIYQNESMNGQYHLENDDGHPVLNGTLAALTNYILYQKLGFFGDIESYHVFIILTSTFLAYLVFLWSYKEYGFFAGIISLLALSLYPLFVAETHNNIKDPIQATFFSYAIFTYYLAVKNKNWRWIALSSLLAGFALGTKLNIIFLPLIIIPWLLVTYWRSIKSYHLSLLRKIPLSIVLTQLFYPILVFLVFFASWPFLWQNPVTNISKFIAYYKGVGIGSSDFSMYAAEWIIYITPVITLFLLGIGILATVIRTKNEKNKTSLLWLLWLAVPIVRVSLPGASIYGGVRQIMEYLPALALLAGLGAKHIVQILHFVIVKQYQQWSNRTMQQSKRRLLVFIIQVSLVFMFAPIVLKIISLHPNQNLYFNELIGGVKGAAKRNFEGWGTTLGNPYLQGVHWLNDNAEPNAVLTLPIGNSTNIPITTLRKDIIFANYLKSVVLRKGEYIMGLTYYEFSLPYEAQYPDVYLRPIHEITVDGVPILRIWKNEEKYTKPGFINEKDVTDNSKISLDVASLLVLLEEPMYLTKIEFSYDPKKCLADDQGIIFTSLDGLKWKKEVEGFLDEQIPFIKKNIKSGKITHLLAAVPTKYLRIDVPSKESCLLKDYAIKLYALQDIMP